MDARHCACLIFTRMALIDGKVETEERDMLTELVSECGLQSISVDDLITEASTTTIEALAPHIDKNADRFFIALRALMLAHVDDDFDADERDLYNRLLSCFTLPRALRTLLDDTAHQLLSPEGEKLDPQVESLYQQSSFVQA